MPPSHFSCLVFSLAVFVAGAAWAQSSEEDISLWTKAQSSPAPATEPTKQKGLPPETISSSQTDIDEVMDKAGELEQKSQSPLEAMYSARVVDELTQFGYEAFDAGHDTTALPAGAAQNDFVLGIGDEISVVIRGQRQVTTTAQINGEGMLIIDDMEPISAAGRTLGDVRAQIQSEADQLYNTAVFVSLSRVSQVNVLVIGNVGNPGRKTLTAYDSVFDALSAAGGITKQGTLRRIRLIRNGQTINLDLYGLLIYGRDSLDVNLRNGDKIVVGPVGPTIAIAGGVKRPGIYEVLPSLHEAHAAHGEKSQLLSLNDMLDMAGGVLSIAQNRFIRMDLSAEGQESIADISDARSKLFGDGDILLVERGKERREGTVTLTGPIHIAGIHALQDNKSLASLLSKETSLPRDTYPLIGAIERWNKNALTRELIAFPPMLVMAGQYDRTLQDGDIVHFFSQEHIRALQHSKNTVPAVSMQEESAIEGLLAEFLEERSVFVRGAVRRPGAYPVSAGATLENVLAMAGGMTLEANTRNVEITRALPTDDAVLSIPANQRRLSVDLASIAASSIGLGAGDTVRINQQYRRVEDSHVLIVGEVRNPGTYDVMPDDTLSTLIARAGGLTAQAYPEGAVFSRVSERKREEARFRAQARDLELRLAAMMEETDEEKRPGGREIAAARDLISQLRQAEALGRITVQANPLLLAKDPKQDMLLESGDRIHIPKRPMTVRVAGEVLSPAALQYRSGHSPQTYISQAGGYTYNADKSRTFIVYPDGSASPLGGSWARSGSIPAGSTIVVPRDPKPFDFMDTAKDLTQILANLATTAIFANAIAYDEAY